MKSAVSTLILALLVSNAFAQWNNNYIELSPKITTETKSITGFEKIDVSEDFKVFIRFSDKEESVKIEANENLHDLIQVEKNGTTLKIYTKSYSTSGGKGHNHVKEKLVAYITANRLTGIIADEDVTIKLEDKLVGDDLNIYLNEDCTLEGHLEVENLVVKVIEDSTLDIEGSARKMKVSANEDCLIKSFDFVVDDLEIDLDEECKAKLTVNGDISLKANEESSFHYRGDGNFLKKRLREDSEVVRH